MDEEGGREVYMKDGFQPAKTAFSRKLPASGPGALKADADS
jgi:hypothetical protein